MFTCMRILGTRVKVHVLVVMLINGLAQGAWPCEFSRIWVPHRRLPCLVLSRRLVPGSGSRLSEHCQPRVDNLGYAAGEVGSGVGCVPRSWPRLRLHLADRLLAGRTHRGKHTGGFRHHPCGLGGCSLREVAERTTGAEDPPNHRAKFELRWEVPKVAGLIPTAAFCKSFLDFSVLRM